MSKSDRYLQFPISALRMGEPILAVGENEGRQRLEDILAFCIVEVGHSFIRKNEEYEVEEIVDSSQWRPDRKLTKHERAVLIGMHVLNVAFVDPEHKISKDSYRQGWEKISRYSSGEKLARLRSDLYWNFRAEQTDLTWREFSILCGVYAGIGARAAARLSFRYIGALASGYSRIADMPTNCVIDSHLIRHTVRKLENRGLFASLCPNQRHTFYSHKLDYTGMSDLLVAKQIEKRESQKAAALRSLQERLAALEQKQAKTPAKKLGRGTAESEKPQNGKPQNGELDTEQLRQQMLRRLRNA